MGIGKLNSLKLGVYPMDRKREIKTTIVLLAGILILGITHYASEIIEQFYNPRNHLSLHILLELISISVAFAIALQGWMIFTHTLSRHRLFIGALFFCIALFDIFHVLSFNGMPFFIMENSVLRPTWFWIISRFFLSIGLFLILTQKDLAIARKYRSYVFSLSLAFVLAVVIIVYGWGDYLPTLMVEGVGVTPLKRGLEYILSFIFLSLLIVMIQQYRKDKSSSRLMLIAAIGFSLFSEIIFTFYQSVHDFDNLLGHIFKVISYSFLMEGLYSSTIEEPFLKQRETQKALEKSEQRLNTIVSTVASGIIMVDSKDHISYVNKTAEQILGLSMSKLLNQKMSDHRENWKTIDESSFPVIGFYFDQIKKSEKGNDHLTTYIRKDGKRLFLSVDSAQMYDEKGELVNIIHSFSDITDLMNAQEKINYLAYYDELTGLPNRYFFKERVEEVLSQIDLYNGVALLLVNLNRFRMVNDSLGNNVGDAFITIIAERLNEFCKPRELNVSRLGGDEFAIIQTDPGDADQVTELAKEINQLLQKPLVSKGFKFHIDATIGISIYNDDIVDGEQFLQTATIAVHEAKKTSQTYLFYHQDSNKKLYENIIIENELRKAIEKEELVLHYQPQVNLNTGKLMGVEALVRWKHPEKGMIPPGKFIPLAEETGLIVPIGKWVIEEACRQIKSWIVHGYPCMRISVNLSMRQFFQEDLVDTVAEALSKSNLEPGYLELEITESMTMDVDRAISMLKRLKKLGVRISVDDFGTGYSSFSNLHLFPVDQLKIDQSFIRNLAVDQANEAIVGTIITLGHHLRLELMAEGVETAEQANFLSSNKCNGIQGYLISKPLPASEIELLFCHDVLYDKKVNS